MHPKLLALLCSTSVLILTTALLITLHITGASTLEGFVAIVICMVALCVTASDFNDFITHIKRQKELK